MATQAVRTWFAEYVADFGPPHNATSFVDYVVAQLHDPAPFGVDGLIEWYRARADELEREANAHAPRRQATLLGLLDELRERVLKSNDPKSWAMLAMGTTLGLALAAGWTVAELVAKGLIAKSSD